MEDVIGGTPLVRLQRLPGPENERRGNVLLAKLEGNNPAGSVKDRPAISMIRGAEERGEISPGDTLLEATSGNTGIGLAMAAAISGYPLVIVMPEDASTERIQTMKAYGADLVLTPAAGGMEEARDVFVSAMGTTGTITGVSRFLKSRNPGVQIVGAQPAEGSRIPGIRAWPPEYVPRIFDPSAVDRTIEVAQGDAEETARRLARAEGIFGGISAGGACWSALQVAKEVEGATIVFVVCDRGDRYLSSGVFPA